MTNVTLDTFLRGLRTLVPESDADQRSDAELLHRFVHHRDESAFTTLLGRHGPMVLNVCRSGVRHSQDAEDVFQATFLVLAGNARSIRQPGSLASWLHGVAQRIAAHARAEASRWSVQPIEETVASSVHDLGDVTGKELHCAVHDELSQLPEKYRAPLVLCYLQERTQEEAARALGWSKSTIRRRLDRGLQLLRDRLTRRGATLSAGLLAALLPSRSVAAGVSADLVRSTVKAGMLVAIGTAASTVGVPTKVALLMDTAIKALAGSRPGLRAFVLLAVTLVLGGTGFLVHAILPTERQPTPEAGPSRPDQARAAPGEPLPPQPRARLGTANLRHAGFVRNVAFLPDGKSVLSASYDGSVRLWEAETGKALRRVTGIGFSVTADAKTLASWEGNGDLALWDLATGRQLRQWRGQRQMYSVALSPDGKVVAAGGRDADNLTPIALWEVSTGRELPAPRDLDGKKSSYAARLVFSPDGKILATSREYDGRIQLWDVATGKDVTPARDLPGGNEQLPPLPFAFSPDGLLLASAGEGGPWIRLWEVATGKERFRLRVAPCGSVAFSPDGLLLASGHANGLIRLWEAATGKEVRSWQGHASRQWQEQEGVACLAFSADSKALISGGTDRTVRLWDVATGQAHHRCPGHEGEVAALTFSADGKTVVSASSDKTIREWDLTTGKEIRRFTEKETPANVLALSPDGKLLAAKGWGPPEARLRLWEMERGRQLRPFPPVKTSSLALAFSPDGQALAYSPEYGLCLVDVPTGKELCRTEKSFLYAAFVAFAPDGKTFAWGSHDDDGKLCFHLADTATGKEICRLDNKDHLLDKLGTLGSTLGWSSFTPDGEALLFGLNERVYVWDLDSKHEPLRFGGDSPWRVEAAALSSDGKTLAAGNQDGTIDLWEVATRKERARFHAHEGATRPGNMGGVSALAWSRDGKALVSGGEDTAILVWDATTLMGQGRAEVADLTPQELERLWSDLADGDARKAYRAIGRLIASPRVAVPFLGTRLQARSLDPERMARLIADLNHDRFSVREQATRELEELGPLAESALKEVLSGQPSLEVRRRVDRLLHRLQERARTAEELRSGRAVEVLEHLGTPEAREVLEGLARGVTVPRLNSDAKAALARLAKQRPISR